MVFHMKLKSLIENANKLEVAEVEIEFIPGIPQIHFLGLPDRLIKESFYRIKSALKSCGYKFPLTNQMIVNIKPNHLRKSSRGVELAVALGILIKTEQIDSSLIRPDWILYGELGLDGHIYEPSDLNQNLFNLQDYSILTGNEIQVFESRHVDLYRIDSLKNIEVSVNKKNKFYKRPIQALDKFYSEDEADFLFIAATSGLHAMLAGDSGAGKSTLAKSLIAFLPEPNDCELVRQIHNWRPVISPHQSITPAAFLGGGSQIYEGEIERVQGGILLLDEFLEFNSEILESLRGPMTGDKLRLSRGSLHREFESSFQVIATTNLCPCGKWTPLKNNVHCRFSRARCTRYLEKFSGPLLDRFGLLMFSQFQAERKIIGQDILKRIQNYFDKKLQIDEYDIDVKVPSTLFSFYSQLSSRRRNYLEVVSKIYAVESLDQVSSCEKNQLNVEIEHLNLAEKWTLTPFEQLEKGMG